MDDNKINALSGKVLYTLGLDNRSALIPFFIFSRVLDAGSNKTIMKY